MRKNHYRYALFILLSLLHNAYGNGAVHHPVCMSKQECTDHNNSCQCYCARVCGMREKKSNDRPVFVPDDPYGNYCYCKQWDLDHVNACALQETMAE